MKELNLPAAAEMAGCIACLYAKDQPAFEQIVGPVSPTVVIRRFFVAPTNTRVACAVYTQPGHLYIVFGGTHVWHQWPRHLTGAASAAYQDDAGVESESVGVHGFHQAVARGMWTDHILPFLPEDLPTREIRVAGHSLGGAVAQLVAWRLAELGHAERTQSITFGAPRVIQGNFRGDRPYAEYRVTNESDIIPLLPHRRSAVVAIPLQVLFALRTAVSRGTGLFGGDTGASLLDPWNHYGPAYRTYNNGAVQVFAPDTEPELKVSPIKAAQFALKEHIIPGYIARLEAAGFLYGMPLQSFQALDIGRIALHDSANPVPAITIDPATGMDIAWSNARLVAPPAAPLTPANVGSTQGIYLRSVGIGLADSTIKANVSEAAMASIWDLTIFVNNTLFGTSNTIALNAAEEITARTIVAEFADRRKRLLGNDKTETGNTFFAESDGKSSPAVEFCRIRDAQNPRVGDVYPVRGTNGNAPLSLVGDPAKLANAADPMFVSVNISLRATVGNVVKRSILKIAGVPDKVVALAGYDGDQIVGDTGLTFDAHLRALIGWLTAPAGAQLGISGLSSATEKIITAWVPDVASGRAKATIAAHGYVDGDQIRITRTKWWYLNRTWEIEAPDVNNIILRRSQMTIAQGPPSNGRANRVVTALGVKQTTFYRFDRPAWLDAIPQAPIPVRITRKRPGARFDPVSFPPNRKKIKR